jgi:hypothetical protein
MLVLLRCVCLGGCGWSGSQAWKYPLLRRGKNRSTFESFTRNFVKKGKKLQNI